MADGASDGVIATNDDATICKGELVFLTLLLSFAIFVIHFYTLT